MDKRRYVTFRLFPVLLMLGAAAFFAACASISIESARDPGYTGKVNRLYVLIKDNGQLKRSYAQNLEKALTERLSARGITSHVQIASPLDLDEERYSRDIKSISPDGVLVIQMAGGTRRLQEVLEVFWDASLTVPRTKARIWRATIHISGGSSLSRMTAMADSILSKMEQDGIIAPAAKIEKQPASAGPPAAPDKPEGGDGK